MDHRNRNILIILGAVICLSFLYGLEPVRRIPILSGAGHKIHQLELSTYDSHMNARKPYPPSNRIVLVKIDSQSIKKMGNFPWPRGVHGKLIDILSRNGASAIGFDVNFGEETTPEQDKLLTEAALKNGNTSAVTYLRLEESGSYSTVKPFPELERSLALTGYPDVNRDSDHVLRKIQLQNQKYPGMDPFFLTVYRIMENRRKTPVSITSDGRTIAVGDLKIPADSDKNMLISFSGEPFLQISYTDVLDERFEKGFFKDRAVLIISTSDPNDQFKVPRITRKPDGGFSSNMFGGEIHASALQTVLEKRFIGTASDFAGWTAGVFLCLLAFGAIVKWSHLRALPVIIAELIAYFLFCRFLFVDKSIWLSFTGPAVTLSVFWAGVFIIESQRLKSVFSQLVPASAAEKMLTSSDATKLGGKTCFGAILFSDIRGYTTLSETMEPGEVLALLNEYHRVLTGVIEKNKGTTFDYAGDGTLVAFGVPDEIETPALWAAKAAIEMQKAVENLNCQPFMKGKPHIRAGIGICTGQVVCGFMGQDKHKKYSVIGDVVNTAARLQGISDIMKHSIIIDETTHQQVKESIPFTDLGEVPLKGKSEPVKIYGTLKN